MSKKIALARPTKIELARLKRRHKLAKRIQKIVKDRLAILVMEFLQTVRECADVKAKLVEQYAEAYSSLSVTTGFHGNAVLKNELMLPDTMTEISAGTKNVAGVRIPFFETDVVDAMSTQKSTGGDSSSYIDRTSELSRQCLETIIQLAELEKSLEFLGLEINKVKRINNALEYIIIPGLEATIRYLTMKFEERDREEFSRLKFVKLMIEKREAYAY